MEIIEKITHKYQASVSSVPSDSNFYEYDGGNYVGYLPLY